MRDKDKEAAFLLALDNVRTIIKDLPGLVRLPSAYHLSRRVHRVRQLQKR